MTPLALPRCWPPSLLMLALTPRWLGCPLRRLRLWLLPHSCGWRVGMAWLCSEHCSANQANAIIFEAQRVSVCTLSTARSHGTCISNAAPCCKSLTSHAPARPLTLHLTLAPAKAAQAARHPRTVSAALHSSSWWLLDRCGARCKMCTAESVAE